MAQTTTGEVIPNEHAITCVAQVIELELTHANHYEFKELCHKYDLDNVLYPWDFDWPSWVKANQKAAISLFSEFDEF